MKHDKITFNNLRNVIKNFKKIKIHVLGDTIVDTYTQGHLLAANKNTND